jgi:hypothetical protein
MLKYSLTAFTVMAALAGPALLPAAASADDKHKDKAHKEKKERRVYDREHRDYHAWNTDEDRLYRDYLTEHHRPFLSFSRMNRKQQHAYWQWRHDHR